MIEDKLWQEYDCPYSNMDFDLCGEDIVAQGDVVLCSCCNKTFVASGSIIANTYIMNSDGSLSIVEFPKNAEERLALIDRARAL